MLLTGGCASITANHDFNPKVDFDDYRTFSWVSAHPLIDPSTTAGDSLEGRIQQVARDLLTAKGYRFVESADQADFVVGFGIGATDSQRMDAYAAGYAGPWHWDGSGAHDGTACQYVEARLVVDIFDVRSHQPAWHGCAPKTLRTHKKKDPTPAIRAALTQIFVNFPPG
jgi:hypothetical protein